MLAAEQAGGRGPRPGHGGLRGTMTYGGLTLVAGPLTASGHGRLPVVTQHAPLDRLRRRLAGPGTQDDPFHLAGELLPSVAAQVIGPAGDDRDGERGAAAWIPGPLRVRPRAGRFLRRAAAAAPETTPGRGGAGRTSADAGPGRSRAAASTARRRPGRARARPPGGNPAPCAAPGSAAGPGPVTTARSASSLSAASAASTARRSAGPRLGHGGGRDGREQG